MAYSIEINGISNINVFASKRDANRYLKMMIASLDRLSPMVSHSGCVLKSDYTPTAFMRDGRLYQLNPIPY